VAHPKIYRKKVITPAQHDSTASPPARAETERHCGQAAIGIEPEANAHSTRELGLHGAIDCPPPRPSGTSTVRPFGVRIGLLASRQPPQASGLLVSRERLLPPFFSGFWRLGAPVSSWAPLIIGYARNLFLLPGLLVISLFGNRRNQDLVLAPQVETLIVIA
jgi:hypothetical protein